MNTDLRHPLYEALVRPRSVCIIGASDDPTKTTARPLRNLEDSGWNGTVHVVNPNRDTVGGYRAYNSLSDLPEVPDHVFVLTGADLALQALRDASRLGVPVATVMADGFVGGSEDARRRTSELREIAQNGTTRILGPSSLGVVSPGRGLILTANAAFGETMPTGGGIFVASQSGSAIGALASRGKDAGVGFHTMVSTGSELNLSLGELCLSSVDDDEVTSYALFLENLTHADHLAEFARAAHERGKPVLAYKLGRSDAAAELAVSHTGALAGDDAVADAALRDLGIIRVHTFDALVEAHSLARTVHRGERSQGPVRVGVVSTTGGGGAMAVDCLAVAGAVPTRPAPETRAKLAEAGIDAGGGTLVDLTLAGTRYEVMKAALDILLDAPEFDVVLAVPGSSARFHPELAVQPIIDSTAAGTPLASFVVPSAPEALEKMREGGVSAFRSPEACADAIVSVFAAVGPRSEIGVVPPAPARTRLLDEARSYAVLSELGVPVAPYAVLGTRDAVEQLPVPAPVVAKIHAEDLAHKSDLGGVVLGIEDPAQLREAVEQIVSAVSAADAEVPTDEVIVQQMVSSRAEALIGYRIDPDVGPIVLLAAGGVLAELYRDRSVRLAPVDPGRAEDMIREITAFRALSGFRGLPEGDLVALRDAVVAISHAGEHVGPSLVELEVNPLMIRAPGAGVAAVDAVVRLSDDAPTSARS